MVVSTDGRIRRATRLCLAALWSGLACSPEDPAEAGGAPVAWEVAAEPTLVIGALGSETTLHLAWPSAPRLSDGRILVADGGLSPRLSVFSPAGEALGTIGREGDGPGEHGLIGSVQAGPDDSIFVYDRGHQRLSVFASDGHLARSATLAVTPGPTGEGGPLRGVTRLHDGVFVGRGDERPRPSEPGTIVRDTIPIGLVDGLLEDFRMLEALPGMMWTTTEVDGRRLFGDAPFSPVVLHATWGRCVFVSSGESPRIAVYASDGVLVAEFDGPGVLRPVTEQHLDTRLTWTLRRASEEEHPSTHRFMQSVATTEHLPYYFALLVDPWGHVWLQEYEPPWGQGPRWYVLSQSGEHLANVTMPKDMTVHEIGAYGVLAKTVGEYDEERIEVLPWITEPSRAAPPLAECEVS